MKFDPEIIRHENNENYCEAVNASYRIWKNEQTEENMLCAALEHWYFMFNDVKYEIQSFPEKQTWDQWNELCDELENIAKHNIRVKFFLGYMLKIGPYLFLRFMRERCYDGTQELGKIFMEEAYKADPTNPVFAMQHEFNVNKTYYEATKKQAVICKEHMKEMEKEFPNEGIVNIYFRCINIIDDYESYM